MELTNYLEAETGSKDENLAILYQLINKSSVYVGSEALYSLSSEDYGITLDSSVPHAPRAGLLFEVLKPQSHFPTKVRYSHNARTCYNYYVGGDADADTKRDCD